MELITNTIVPQNIGQQEIVEIKLWEIYLLNHPANLYRILTEFSVDDAPAENDPETGRVVFRFIARDWEYQVKPLLYQHRIPVIVRSNGFQAIRTKGVK
jgi:hypothetical protein